jgi:predicted nucleic acid-binding protein
LATDVVILKLELIVELPDEIHGELKKRAAVDHNTLKNIVTELIHEYLYSPEKHVSTKKKTCLCGSWDDAGLLIASIALLNNATLITNNIENFKRINGLKIENWS